MELVLLLVRWLEKLIDFLRCSRSATNMVCHHGVAEETCHECESAAQRALRIIWPTVRMCCWLRKSDQQSLSDTGRCLCFSFVQSLAIPGVAQILLRPEMMYSVDY